MEVNKKLWSRQSSWRQKTPDCSVTPPLCWPQQRSVVTRLSALNVEELRQEHGMEALKTVSAHFAACMHGQVDRDAGTGEWWEHLPSYVLQTPHITIQVNRRSYLLYKLLQMLCLRIAVECVSSLAVNLQIHFLQSGVLWHLLMTLSQWCKTQWTLSGMRCSTATRFRIFRMYDKIWPPTGFCYPECPRLRLPQDSLVPGQTSQ